MKRKITSKLYEWKNKLNGRMPLLIYGARQVGKTFEMREFGALYYKNTIYVNFETDERIGKYFETDIHADHVISVLEKYYQAKIVPENTLIIFDEIQMCERALTSLKYFSEEAPEYHVMAAGSLLGVAVNWKRCCGQKKNRCSQIRSGNIMKTISRWMKYSMRRPCRNFIIIALWVECRQR